MTRSRYASCRGAHFSERHEAFDRVLKVRAALNEVVTAARQQDAAFRRFRCLAHSFNGIVKFPDRVIGITARILDADAAEACGNSGFDRRRDIGGGIAVAIFKIDAVIFHGLASQLLYHPLVDDRRQIAIFQPAIGAVKERVRISSDELRPFDAERHTRGAICERADPRRIDREDSVVRRFEQKPYPSFEELPLFRFVRQLAGQVSGSGTTRTAYWGELVASSLPRAVVGPLADRLKATFLRQLGLVP